MEWFLEDYELLERIIIDKYKLKEDCLSDMEDDELFKTMALQRINGFNSENPLSTYEEIREIMSEYCLDIKKLYLDTSIDEKFRMYLDSIVYLYRGFMIKVTFCSDYDTLFRFIKENCNYLDDYIATGKPVPSIITHAIPEKYQITMFNLFSEIMTKEDRISIGRRLYFSSDYGANNLDSSLIEEIFNNGNTGDEDCLTIYRGVGSKSKGLSEAYAWTQSLDVAKFFATRFIQYEEDFSKVKVYKLNIAKEDILSIEGGTEEEVIVNNSSLEYYILADLIEEVQFDNTVFHQMPSKLSGLNEVSTTIED